LWSPKKRWLVVRRRTEELENITSNVQSVLASVQYKLVEV